MAKSKSRSQPGWVPVLSAGGGSWATRFADTLAADVAAGRLAPGDRLPTQRELGRRLGVTTGTVNRGYAIAARAGLVTGEVGRGTFVTGSTAPGIHDAGLARGTTGAIDLALNYPAGGEAESALKKTLSRLASRELPTGLLALAPYAGPPKAREAGARWLRQFQLSASAEEVLLCTSVQHGLAAALAALAAPGDVVLTETLTSPGIKALAALHHLRLVAVAGDDQGISPEALVEARRSTGARVLYTMPTLHTPTTTTMPEDRRRIIAEVLRKEKLTAIEDDAWGFLAAGKVTPLRALASGQVVYLTSFSKSLAPGIRVGYVVAPSSLQRPIASCLGAMTWTAPLLVEVVGEWIKDGTATSIMEQRIRTARERRRLADTLLGSALVRSALPAYHCWLPLPEPWRIDEFVTHASAHGVSLASTDAFVPGRTSTPHAVRVCTGTEANLQRLETGLRVIAGMLKSGPTGYSVPGV
jgi:DNA-binding transcriptional MocR family regulator